MSLDPEEQPDRQSLSAPGTAPAPAPAPNDWRRAGQEGYLTGRTFRWAHYRAPHRDWDHDHCEFCWVKFVEPADAASYRERQPNEQVLTEGFVSPDPNPRSAADERWVCPTCFHDFAAEMNFKVERDGSDDEPT